MKPEIDSFMCQLFRRAQTGDNNAYRELLQKIAEVLEGYYRPRLRGANSSHIEDLVQETLLSVHRAYHTFDPDEKLGPWLYAIARYRLIDFYRRHRRDLQLQMSYTANAAVESTASDSTEPPHQLDIVIGALGDLPQKQRTVIEQLKLQGRSVREVAERLGTTENNIKVIASRGYQQLRRWLRGGV